MVNEEILRKAQLVMLDVLIEFDRICKKYNINYWLDSGTFLGAVRHKGFIPWDDDIDVCMLKEDYEKFLKIVIVELKEKYFFQTNITDKFCDIPWSRIRDRNNFGIYKNEKYHQGLGMDIFPMKSYSFINKTLYKLLFRLKNLKYQEVILKKSIKIILKNILVILKINKIAEKYFNYFLRKEKKESIGYEYAFSRLFKYKDIFPLSEIEFEGHKFLCPNNADAYLKNLYGNTYMKLPPEKDRICHVKEIR